MRALLDPVHHLGLPDLRRLQDGGNDVDDVVELIADASPLLDPGRPGDGHALPDPAEVGRNLLGPRERRAERPGPRHGHVVVRPVRAPGVVEVLELGLHGDHDPVEHGHLVGRAHERALGGRAVVAADVDDERVVELAHVVDRLDDPANLVIGVHEVGRVHVHLAEEHLLLVGGELLPLLQQILRPGGELGVLRDHAELLLVGVDPLPQLVPALVEELEVGGLLDPLRRRVVGRVRATRSVVDEEGLIRRERVHLVHVFDGLVGHRGGQVEAGVSLERVDVGGVSGQVGGLPLVRVTAHEAVEVLEAHPGGPLVEGADGGRLEGGRVVVLPEPGGAIAVVPQDRAERRLVLREEAVVAREPGRLLGDHAEAGRVVVAAGDERGARRRAERRGVKVGVAQAILGDAVERRRGDDAAEGGGRPVADVVGDDEQHVGRALRRDDARRPEGLRALRRPLDPAAELLGRRRQLPAVDGRRGRRGPGYPGRALGAGCGPRHDQERQRGQCAAHPGDVRCHRIATDPHVLPRST